MPETIKMYDVRGLFDTENDAYRFLDWYADQYNIRDTDYLELNQANFLLEGVGEVHDLDDSERSEKPVEQTDFDALRSSQPESTDGDNPE